MLIRAQEMARYVEVGVLDCGLTGKDWIMEQNAEVHEIAELIYAKEGLRPVKWVIKAGASGIVEYQLNKVIP